MLNKLPSNPEKYIAWDIRELMFLNPQVTLDEGVGHEGEGG